ncbi:MAG: response regulator, partial [Psychrobacter sp.]
RIHPTTLEVGDFCGKMLKHPSLTGVSYQLIVMMPSGQTYIHRYTRPNESSFSTVTFPTARSSSNSSSIYRVNARNLTGTIQLESGHQVYLILRHKPLKINWTSYQYWLLLMVAILLFVAALLYILKRHTYWEQLILYTDNLSGKVKEAYTPPPFLDQNSTEEFLRLGHALSRVSYQMHSDHRHIKTLGHRLERLVDRAPLAMAMLMRHGQISFFNQRFEQLFTAGPHGDNQNLLTDFVVGADESTQLQLQKLENLRVTRTLIVQAAKNRQAYQLHITPWFGEHGQVHGFTVLLNNINDFIYKAEQQQLQSQQLQKNLDGCNEFKFALERKLRLPLETLIDTLEPFSLDKLTDKQDEILHSLLETSHSMLTTLNDMLDREGIAVRKTRINIEAVDVYKLCQEANGSMVERARQQGIELIYDFDPDCPRYIDTDKIRLHQILLSLLNNAFKFTSSGHIALVIKAISSNDLAKIHKDNARLSATHRRVVSDQTSRWICFSIQDSGEGIAEAQKKQLLHFFSQDNSDNNTAQPYTSEPRLGFSNINSFARLFGGFIEIESVVNQGSTFNLYLPCHSPNYQSIYHRNPHLSNIHFIAIVNQPLVAEHLKRLCQHLSITASIYTSINLATIQSLTNHYQENRSALAPVLLLDYEYYEYYDNNTAKIHKHTDLKLSKIDKRNRSLTAISPHSMQSSAKSSKQIVVNANKKQALDDLISITTLPKILLSIKPERLISSTLLHRYDGFLLKPLDSALLLSELARLALPMKQTLDQTKEPKNATNKPAAALESNTEEVKPLILVAEDSLTNQKIACKLLSKLGYRSVIAADGQQALERLKTQRQEISVILMDCRMPVMDGLQATQTIRAHGDDIPIIALTANNSKEDREACIQAGMDEFLSKPIDKNKLKVVLQKMIETP